MSIQSSKKEKNECAKVPKSVISIPQLVEPVKTEADLKEEALGDVEEMEFVEPPASTLKFKEVMINALEDINDDSS